MNDNTPLVSIALCTYNGSKFLREQLNSLLNQTYNSIEIIIVDDCSKDDTLEIIQEYASNNSNIKYSINSKNIGFNKNFELAISKCNGEYIAISDQDDIWKENKVETLMAHIEDNWLIFSNSIMIDNKGEVINKSLLKKDFSLNNKSFMSLLLYNFVTGHTCLFNKSFVKQIFPLPETDFYDWWMGFLALYNDRLAFCNEELTYYRIHNESYIQQKNAVKEIQVVHSKETLQHLEQVLKYDDLKECDYKFILSLSKAFKSHLIIKLFCHLIRHYNKFFPDLKPRKRSSLVNFALKYSRNKSL